MIFRDKLYLVLFWYLSYIPLKFYQNPFNSYCMRELQTFIQTRIYSIYKVYFIYNWYINNMNVIFIQTLAKHIMSVHMGGSSAREVAGELPLALVRRYSSYCRTRCGPRLSPTAAQRLAARYVLMRTGAASQERQADKRLAIPITVRYVYHVSRDQISYITFLYYCFILSTFYCFVCCSIFDKRLINK